MIVLPSIGSGCRGKGEPARPGDASAAADAGAKTDASLPDASQSIPASGPERGRFVYGLYCALCHGPNAEGYKADEAPALGNEEFLATASDAHLRRAIERGRPGTSMSAWAFARGGPLLDNDVTAAVEYLRTLAARPFVSVDDRKVTGNVAAGARVFSKECASCHGKAGRDGRYTALANPELLATVSDGFLATAIERGRPGTPMPAFAGTLSPSAISDVTALIRSWARPPDETIVLPPKPGALEKVVVNPNGPQPALDPKADFVSVDEVKRELGRGASFVFADARAPSDYAHSHIAGAVSVPFYQVASYAPQIPKDRYIITYCTCPHAESVPARDAFRALGYPRVAVLDEGVGVWRERGYPTRAGATP